jgi:hypothetical protein
MNSLTVIITREEYVDDKRIMNWVNDSKHKYLTIVFYGPNMKIPEPFIISQSELIKIEFKLVQDKKASLDDVFNFLSTIHTYNKFPIKEFIIL